MPNNIKISHIVERQIPEYIRSNNPLFVKFLEYYYEFLEEQQIQSIIQDILDYGNYMFADEQFLQKYFEELKILPLVTESNYRFIANHIYDIYKSKGSIDSIKLLVKIVTGKKVTVTMPYKNILRASDGVWNQEKYIRIEKLYGNITDDSLSLIIDDRIQIDIDRIEVISNSVYNIYFFGNLTEYPKIGDSVHIHADDGTYSFIGVVISTVSKFNILSGGFGWKLGQIIRFPGTVRDTLLKVSNINSVGAITQLDVLQYGIGHTDGSVIRLSPFNKPLGSQYEINTDTPNVYELKIFEGTTGTSENVYGMSSEINETSYNSSNYDTGTYFGKESLSLEENNEIQDGNIPSDNAITIEEWLLSRVIIELKFDSYGKVVGRWLNNNGIINNPSIRLQDNKYYQLHSYVISSEANPNIYKESTNFVHPSGIARYFNQEINSILNINQYGTLSTLGGIEFKTI